MFVVLLKHMAHAFVKTICCYGALSVSYTVFTWKVTRVLARYSQTGSHGSIDTIRRQNTGVQCTRVANGRIQTGKICGCLHNMI